MLRRMNVTERKNFFINELKAHYEGIIEGVKRAESSAALAATSIQDQARTSDDRKGAASEARLAAGYRQRRQQATEELEALLAFAARGVPRFRPDSTVDLGAMLDVSVETESGSEERTVFLLPVGAGTELKGPGGDGFISVITPSSPVGRALRGARVGDTVEIITAGSAREWTLVDLI
jgi:transcription elongation GreA/GreB family factor